MKLNKVTYYLLLWASTAISCLFEIGIPFVIIGMGTILGLWNFSWGGVFILYAIGQAMLDVKMSMGFLNIHKEDDFE